VVLADLVAVLEDTLVLVAVEQVLQEVMDLAYPIQVARLIRTQLKDREPLDKEIMVVNRRILALATPVAVVMEAMVLQVL
jgi:hypothetical protein